MDKNHLGWELDMKTMKRIVFLSAVLLAVFSATACDDSASEARLCTENSYKCQDNAVLLVCKNNKFIEDTTCASSNNEICVVDACIDKNAPQCQYLNFKPVCVDSKTLKICDNKNKLVATTCPYDCKDGACVETCNPDKAAPYCRDGLLFSCSKTSKTFESSVCPNNCYNGACIEKTPVKDCSPACSKEQICNDKGRCVNTVADTAIGKACSCAGADCDIVINGDELKAIYTPEALDLLQTSVWRGLTTKDKITIPNIFSKNIVGCEDVVVPDGMTVGCFREAKISFDKPIIDSITEILNNSNIGDILTKGIPLTSPDGYCMTAALNVDTKVLVNAQDLLQEKKINAILNKLNTGNHSKAVVASCPAGTHKLANTLNTDIPGALRIAAGIDLCLKACLSEDDCRKDYSCIELFPEPGETPGEHVKKSICFDKANVDLLVVLLNG